MTEQKMRRMLINKDVKTVAPFSVVCDSAVGEVFRI
jgi:hypothetical protein